MTLYVRPERVAGSEREVWSQCVCVKQLVEEKSYCENQGGENRKQSLCTIFISSELFLKKKKIPITTIQMTFVLFKGEKCVD